MNQEMAHPIKENMATIPQARYIEQAVARVFLDYMAIQDEAIILHTKFHKKLLYIILL